jgi:hypothetical protein
MLMQTQVHEYLRGASKAVMLKVVAIKMRAHG